MSRYRQPSDPDSQAASPQVWPQAVGLTAAEQNNRPQPDLHVTPAPSERPLRHDLRTRKVYSLLKRVVNLELAERDESRPAKVRLVIELDMALPELGEPPVVLSYVDPTSAGGEIVGLEGGVGVLLARQLRHGEDFVVLTRGQQEWLEKMPT